MLFTYRLPAEATAEFRTGFERACRSWETACDLQFEESATEAADIVLVFSNEFGPGAALIGGPTIWIDPSLADTWGNWEPGTYSQLVLAHEIGHVLGLYHPHDYGSSATMSETIMSYTYINARDGNVLYPEGPGIIDIVDVRLKYGDNDETNGSTIHAIDRSDRLLTIFDIGGERDVLDLSRLGDGCLVDLGAGTVDTFHGFLRLAGDFEAVNLGSGADTVTLGTGDLVFGLSKLDSLRGSDGDIDKLNKSEKKEAGLTGRWFDVPAADGGGDALVQWEWSKRALDRILIEET